VDTKQPCVYLLASGPDGTLYAGVTSHLQARVWQHKTGALPGFTKQYGVDRLVWFERHDTTGAAIGREKQLKAGSRRRKLELINAMNPTWRDLYGDIL